MVIYCNRNIGRLGEMTLLRFCWTSGMEYHVNGINGRVLPSSLTSLMSAEDMIQWKLNIYFSDNTKFSVNLNLFRMVGCKHKNWLSWWVGLEFLTRKPKSGVRSPCISYVPILLLIHFVFFCLFMTLLVRWAILLIYIHWLFQKTK